MRLKSTKKKAKSRSDGKNIKSFVPATFASLGKVENIFLVLGFAFGLAFLLITPPFQSPDEPDHFFRAYQISEGHILPQKQGDAAGGEMPSSILTVVHTFDYLSHTQAKATFSKITSAEKVPVGSGNTQFTNFSNTALYSPLAYLPQVVGIWAGRMLRLGPLNLMYMARLAALIFWLILTYSAIRIIPTGKWALCTISFIPMLIFQAPTVSADSLTFGLTALVVASVLYFIHSKKTLSHKHLVYIFVLAIFTSLIKLPYSLAFLALLLIPCSKFNNKKTYLVFWSITLLLFIGLLGSWYVVMQKFYIPGRSDVLVSPHKQLAFMMRHPGRFPHAIFQTYIADEWLTSRFLQSFLGSLGWRWIGLPLWLSALVIIDILLGFLSIKGVLSKISVIYKSILFLIPLGMFIIINLLLYMSWTKIGGHTVEGIQGRYFLPVAMLLIPFVAAIKPFSLRIHGSRILIMAALQVIILSATLVYLYSGYYL